MLRHELPGGASLRLLEESDAEELFALTDRNRADVRHGERYLDLVVYAMLADDWRRPAA